MPKPFDISQLVSSLSTQKRGDKELLANNTVMSLAARVLAAQFGDELAFPGKPGSASVSSDVGTANADYDLRTGNMRVSPYANNNLQTMYMKKDALGGYTGDFHGNPTTEDVLNMVNTLRHELQHARTNTRGSVAGYPVKSENITKYLPTGKNSWDLVSTLQHRALPSMDATYPLDEFLATAVPLNTAETKLGPLTRKQQGYKQEIDQVLFNYPGVSKLIQDMSRPELFTK